MRRHTRGTNSTWAGRLMWYRALAKTVGDADAARVVGMIFDQYGNRGTMTLTPALQDAVHELIKQEVMRIQGRKVHVGQLSGQARNGSLRNRLAGRTLALAQYCHDPQASDLNKAYRWIVGSWRGQGAGSVRAALWERGQTGGGGPAFGSDDALIANLHAAIVQGAPAQRPPSSQPVPYPSHVGGRYVLRWSFQVAR